MKDDKHKDDQLKEFLKGNTQFNSQKPVNEYSDILKKIEDKPSFWQTLGWPFQISAVAAFSGLVIFTVATLVSHQGLSPTDKKLMTFMAESLEEPIYEDESIDEDISLLILIDES